MIVKANFEMAALLQGGTHGVTAAQTADQPQQPFSESLRAATKTTSEDDSASGNDTRAVRRQKSDSEDAKPQSAASDSSTVQQSILSQQTVPTTQAIPAQQAQLNDPNAAAFQVPLSDAAASPDASSALFNQLSSASANIVPSGKDSSQGATILSSASTGARQGSVPAADGNVVSTTAQGSIPTSAPNTSAAAVANPRSDSTSEQAQNAVANSAHTAIPTHVPDASTNSAFNAGPAPALPASVNEAALASPLKSTPAEQTLPSASTAANQAAPAINPTVPDAIANQPVVPNQRAGASSLNTLPVGQSSSLFGVKSKGNAKSTANDAADAEQHAQTVSAEAGSQAGSQLATSSSDQNQGGASAQGQNAVPVQMNLANHTGASVPQARSMATGAAALSASSFAGVAAPAAKASDNTAAASVPTPQAPPVINFAELIQNMGQTEMRVGMRTNEFGNISINTSANRDANTAQISLDHGEQAKAVSGALSNSIFNAAPAPTLQAGLNASVQAALASTLKSAPTEQTPPPVVAGANQAAPAINLPVSDAIANQVVLPNQQAGELQGAVRAGASRLNTLPVGQSSSLFAADGKGNTKSTANDATDAKQHMQPTSVEAGSQAGSQSATSSSDQNQGGASAQGQNAVPVQMNFANHTVAAMAQAQSTATGATPPTASSFADVAAPAAKASDNTAAASVPTPQAPPAINTAQLIQHMGQTEMRVGMRSDEFGNISINTSTTRDVITAQISLDHGELAKVLASHLPEMQARLGVNQPADVRINMYGAGTGQNSGTPGGTSSGSADQSQSGNQQSGNATSSYAGNSVVERPLSPAIAASTSYGGGLDARLDIRV